MSADGKRTVSAQIDDPELLEALEEAEGEASLSSLVRRGLRAELLNERREASDVDVAPVARRGLRAMREHVGEGQWITVSTAESVVANYCNIPKDTVKPTVFRPLRSEGIIALNQSVHDVFIVLYPGNRSDGGGA
jgi:hypothetical protein